MQLGSGEDLVHSATENDPCLQEEAEPFPLDDRVVYILDDVCISHRQLPRPENPHGEETEDTYLVGELEDLEDVEIVIRPEREPPSM